MTDLIKRLEEATEGSRELEWKIERMVEYAMLSGRAVPLIANTKDKRAILTENELRAVMLELAVGGTWKVSDAVEDTKHAYKILHGITVCHPDFADNAIRALEYKEPKP